MRGFPLKGDHLVLIRHGSTELNETGTLISAQDPGLSLLGREQCAHLQRWARTRLDGWAIASSPSRRATETAMFLLRGESIGRLLISDSLRERHLGYFEGLNGDDLRKRRVDVGLNDLDMTLVWDGAAAVEQDEQILERLVRGLEGLPLGPPPGRGQVAVTHAGVIKSVLHHVLEVPSERPYAFRIGLGCAIVLQKTKGYWELCEFWPNPAATARYLD